MDIDHLLFGIFGFLTLTACVCVCLLPPEPPAKPSDNSDPPTSVLRNTLQILADAEKILEENPETSDRTDIIQTIDKSLHQLVAFLHFLGHPNADDLQEVCHVLSCEEHPLELLANQWLYVARVLWKEDEEAIMLPWYEFNWSRKDRSTEKEGDEYLYRPPHVRRRFKAPHGHGHTHNA